MDPSNYFAYGTNMDAEQMGCRCPDALCRGPAVLRGWRFCVNSRGVATVAPEAASEVWGIRWDVTSEDLASLDYYEGVTYGTYTRRVVTIRDEAGSRLEAIVYVAAVDDPGTPRTDYMDVVIGAAQAAELPGVYLAELESWRS
jgi:gamma-glutamylcyclotransferase (GGCT)/AIG2-like uncharacterized protein YtfP